MEQLTTLLERSVAQIGKLASWLSLLIVIIIVVDVFMRYTFSITSSASFEIEWHLFGALFLLASGWSLQEDKHVRVDVFYQKFSTKSKAWINLTGTVFLLLPFCYVGFVEGLQFTITSYQIGETSPDPGGLPGRFIIKSMIPAGMFLLGMQGIAIILKSIKDILVND
ncbi:MAG: TRAP transporter small permease subunit [Cyclobacteriaceae bacterium]